LQGDTYGVWNSQYVCAAAEFRAYPASIVALCGSFAPTGEFDGSGSPTVRTPPAQPGLGLIAECAPINGA
jgi:hypothetical protein